MSTYFTGNPADVIQRQNASDKRSGIDQFRVDDFGFGRGNTRGAEMTAVDNFAGMPGINPITFPAGLGDDPAQPVFMTYVSKKIVSAVGGTMGDMSFQPINVTKDAISQVALPIPTGINVAYAQGWDQTDVNAVQGSIMNSTAFRGAADMMRDTAEGNTDTTVAGGLNALKTAGMSALGMAGNAGEEAWAALTTNPTGAVSSIMSKIGKMGVSGNAVAGVGLGVAGKILGPAMSTAAGFSSFSQVMAHYQGPAFRNFNFTYTLRPLSPKDQQNIVKIVNFFKIASAPSQISNGLFRIYETPYVFKIGFYSKNGELKDVNRIAHCACTNVSVSYGGDRFQTFSGTNSPVETNIALSFKEIEPITRTEMEAGY